MTQVDRADNNGVTPLMAACMSQVRAAAYGDELIWDAREWPLNEAQRAHTFAVYV